MYSIVLILATAVKLRQRRCRVQGEMKEDDSVVTPRSSWVQPKKEKEFKFSCHYMHR